MSVNTYIRYKLSIRIISLLVIATFTLSDIAFAAPTIQGNVLSHKPPIVSKQISSLPFNPMSIDLPTEYVSLNDYHIGQNGKLIIHIQDAHTNYSAQLNISKALDYLTSVYPQLSLVLTEGASKDSTLSPIRNLAPLEEWRRYGKKFLLEGLVDGIEFFNLTSDHPLIIQGIEKDELYEENLVAFGDLSKSRSEVLGYIHNIQNSIDRLKAKIYPKEILVYEKTKSDTEGRLDSFLHLINLANEKDITNQDYRQLQLFLELKDYEEKINFEKVTKQYGVLHSFMSLNDFVHDLDHGKNFNRASILDKSNFFQSLISEAKKQGVEISRYPELFKYSIYLDSFSKLNFELLLSEIEHFEYATYNQLLKSDQSKLLWTLDRYLEILVNAHKIRLSNSEFEILKNSDGLFQSVSWQAFLNDELMNQGYYDDFIPFKEILEDSKVKWQEFYKFVGLRDQAFIHNAEKHLNQYDQTVAFMVTGGYHTENLTYLLKQEGYSYIVLAPRVEHETDARVYEELLLEVLAGIEKETLDIPAAASRLSVLKKLTSFATNDRVEALRAIESVMSGYQNQHPLASRLAAIDDLLDMISRGELKPEDYVNRYGHVAIYFLIRDARKKGLVGKISAQTSPAKINSSIVAKENKLKKGYLTEDVFNAFYEVLQGAHQRQELITKYSGLFNLKQLVEDVKVRLRAKGIASSINSLSMFTTFINSKEKMANILRKDDEQLEDVVSALREWNMPNVQLSWDQYEALQEYLNSMKSDKIVAKYGQEDGSGIVNLIREIQTNDILSSLRGINLGSLTGLLNSPINMSGLLNRSQSEFKDWNMPKISLTWDHFITIQTYLNSMKSNMLVERYGQEDGSGVVNLIRDIQTNDKLSSLRGINLGHLTNLLNSPLKISGLLGRQQSDFKDWNMPNVQLSWDQYEALQKYLNSMKSNELVAKYGQEDGLGVVNLIRDIETKSDLKSLRGINLANLTGLLNSPIKISGLLGRQQNDFKDWNMPKISLTWDHFITIQTYLNSMKSNMLVERYGQEDGSGVVNLIRDIQTKSDLKSLRGINLGNLTGLLNSPIKISGLLNRSQSDFKDWNMPKINLTWDQYKTLQEYLNSMKSNVLVERYGQEDGSGVVNLIRDIETNDKLSSLRGINLANLTSLLNSPLKMSGLLGKQQSDFKDWNMPHVQLTWDQYKTLQIYLDSMKSDELVAKYGQEDGSGVVNLIRDIQTKSDLKSLRGINLGSLTGLLNSPIKMSGLLNRSKSDFKDWNMPKIDLTWDQYKTLQDYLNSMKSDKIVAKYGQEDGSGIINLIRDIQTISDLSSLRGINLSSLTNLLSSPLKVSGLLGRQQSDFKDWNMPHVQLTWDQYKALQAYLNSMKSDKIVAKYGQEDGSGVVNLIRDIETNDKLSSLRGMNLANLTSLLNSPLKISGLLGRQQSDFKDWNMPVINLAWDQYKTLQEYLDSMKSNMLVGRYGQEDGSGVVNLIRDIETNDKLSSLRGINLANLTGLLNSPLKISGLLGRQQSEFKDWNMPHVQLTWDQYKTLQKYLNSMKSNVLVAKYGQEDGSGVVNLIRDIQTNDKLSSLRGIHLINLTGLLNSPLKVSGLLGRQQSDFKDWNMPIISLTWDQYETLQKYLNSMKSNVLVAKYGQEDGSGIFSLIRDIQTESDLKSLRGINLGHLTGLLNSPLKVSGLLGRQQSEFKDWNMPHVHLTWDQYKTLQEYLNSMKSNVLVAKYGQEDGSGIFSLIRDIQTESDLKSLRGINLGYLTGLLNSPLKVSGLLGRQQSEFKDWNMPYINLTWNEFVDQHGLLASRLAAIDDVLNLISLGSIDPEEYVERYGHVAIYFLLRDAKNLGVHEIPSATKAPKHINKLISDPEKQLKNGTLTYDKFFALRTVLLESYEGGKLIEQYSNLSNLRTLVEDMERELDRQHLEYLDTHLGPFTGLINSPDKLAKVLNRPDAQLDDWNMPKVNLSWKQFTAIQDYFSQITPQELVRRYGQADGSGLVNLIGEIQVMPQLAPLAGIHLGQLTSLISPREKIAGLIGKRESDVKRWGMPSVNLTWRQFETIQRYFSAMEVPELVSRYGQQDGSGLIVLLREIQSKEELESLRGIHLGQLTGLINSPKKMSGLLNVPQTDLDQWSMPHVGLTWQQFEIIQKYFSSMESTELVAKYGQEDGSGVVALIGDIQTKPELMGLRKINLAHFTGFINSSEKISGLLGKSIDDFKNWKMPYINLTWEQFEIIQKYFKTMQSSELVSKYGQEDGSGIMVLMSEIQATPALKKLRGLNLGQLTGLINSPDKMSGLLNRHMSDFNDWKMPFIDLTVEQFKTIQEHFNSLESPELVAKYGQENGSGVVTLVREIQTVRALSPLKGVNLGYFTGLINSPVKMAGLLGRQQSDFKDWKMPKIELTWDQYEALQEYLDSMKSNVLVDKYGQEDGSGVVNLIRDIETNDKLSSLRGINLSHLTGLLNSPLKISGLLGRSQSDFKDWNVPIIDLTWSQYKTLQIYLDSMKSDELVAKYGQEDGSGVVNLIRDIQTKSDLKSLRGINLGSLTGLLNSPIKMSGLLNRSQSDFKDWNMPKVNLNWDQLEAIQSYFSDMELPELVRKYGAEDGSGLIVLLREIQTKDELASLRGIHLGRITSLINSPIKMAGLLNGSKDDFVDWKMPYIGLSWRQYTTIKTYFGKKHLVN